MTFKHNNIPDWTQAQLNTVIAGGSPPLLPAGTVLNDIVLPSDWNNLPNNFLATTGGTLTGNLYENANIIFQTPQSFGGNNSSYVTVPNTGSRFCFGSGDFTISYWKYMASGASGNGATMLVNYTSGGYVPIAILGGGAGRDYLYISHAGSAWDIAPGKTIAYPQDQWSYIVITRVGSTFTIYVNGAAINTFSSALSVWNNGGATNPLNIGGDYSGKLDHGSYLEEVNFYNVGLSSAQVTAYYNAGKGLFGTASDTGLIAGFHFDGTLIDYKSANNGSWVNGASYSSGKYLSGGTTSVSLPISVLNNTVLLPATSFSTAIKSVDGNTIDIGLGTGNPAIVGTGGQPGNAGGEFVSSDFNYGATLGIVGYAGYFTDNVRHVYLANSTTAVDALGMIKADGGNGQIGYLAGGNSDYGVSGGSGNNGDGGGHFFDTQGNDIVLANNNINGNYVVKAKGAAFFDYNGSGLQIVSTTNGSYALLTQDNGNNSGSNSVSFSDGTSAMRAYVISGDKYTSINDSQGANDSTMDAYRTFKTHVFLNANNLTDDNGYLTGITGIASAAMDLGYDAGFFSNTGGNRVRLATGNNSAVTATQGSSGYAAGDFSSDRSGAPIVYLINYNTGVDASAGNNSGGIAVSGYGGSTYGNIGGIFQHNYQNYAQAILATSGIGPDPLASTAGYFTYSSGGYGVLDAYEVAIGSDDGAIIAQDYNGLGSPVNNVQLANRAYAIQSTGDCVFYPAVGGYVSIGLTASAYGSTLEFDNGRGTYAAFGDGSYGMDIVTGDIAAIRTGYNGIGSGNTVTLTTAYNAIEAIGHVRMQGLTQGAGPPGSILTTYQLYVDSVTGLIYCS